MPSEMDHMGRLTLFGMRQRVRRRLASLMNDNIVDGAEVGNPIYNNLFTDQDIDMALNAALNMRLVDLISIDSEILADEEVIDVVVNQTEYELPADMAVLRALYWKDPAVTHTVVPRNERVIMYQVEPQDGPSIDVLNGAPTYQRRLNFIVLNDIPKVANPGGILVDYVKWLMPLLVEDQVLETQHARILQEVIVFDAVVDLQISKLKVSTPEIVGLRDLYASRLNVLSAVSSSPPVFDMRPLVAYNKYKRHRWG